MVLLVHLAERNALHEYIHKEARLSSADELVGSIVDKS